MTEPSERDLELYAEAIARCHYASGPEIRDAMCDAIAAAREEGRREEEQLHVQTTMLAHRWMAAHDALLSWIQNRPEILRAFIEDAPHIDLPKPADLPEAIGKAKEEGRREERAECVEIVKYWFGGNDISDSGYECVEEIQRRAALKSIGTSAKETGS
jgi:hypothetical protein